MDISKIICESLDESMKEVADGKFKNYCNVDDEEVSESGKQNAMLMNYSAILLRNYHNELKQILANQGIDI